MNQFPLHRPSEHRSYSPDQRAAALAEAQRLVRAAMSFTNCDARTAALTGACLHDSPLVGWSATALLADAVARHGRPTWFC
ncbi:MAG: hypothetical protein AB7I42_26585 [Bradyrhizobium sp.]|uniref:hypothetical protein n=1 Tax=Bradyrhizobium sp. TaxID=376 RepID=UPI003D0D32EC